MAEGILSVFDMHQSSEAAAAKPRLIIVLACSISDIANVTDDCYRVTMTRASSKFARIEGLVR
jgi:hypothetical protein